MSVKNGDENQENLRVAYKAALDLWSVQTDVTWARLNSALVTNSILIAAVVLLVADKGVWVSVEIAIGFCLAGIVLNGIWISNLVRAFGRAKYYVWCAREMEARLLGVGIVGHRGADHSDGKPVRLHAGADERVLQIGRLGRFEASGTAYFGLGIFLALFLVIITVLIIGMT
jgi:hypothetical protein